MKQLASPTSTETRSYNSLVQLTAIGSTVYSYSANQNNGRITQTTDPQMGTVTYGYDSLNRLASATSSASWGETFTYDGFGNLTDKTPTSGAAPPLHVTMDPAANNRLSTSSGYGYDATGNLTAGPGFLYTTYDVQNRMATFVPTSGGTEYYSYGPDNIRMWKKPPSGAEEVYFYGAQGEKLGRFSYSSGVFGTLRRSVYFGARVVNGGQDRLGSVPDHGGYYPYGEAQTAGFNDQDRFATYYRDGTSLLDYARNRYYSSMQGRFMSADPYRASGGPADPGSWNRYAYTRGDPVNRVDPFGLDDCIPSPGIDFCVTGTGTGSTISTYPVNYASAASTGYLAFHRKARTNSTYDWVQKLGMAANSLSKISQDDLPHPCDQDIASLTQASNGKITWSSIEGAVNKLVAYNGKTSTFLYNDVFQNSPNYVAGRTPGFTVANYFDRNRGTNALTILGGNALGMSVVFFRPSFVANNSPAGNEALLMHEMLHTLDLEDPEIENALGISGSHGSADIDKAFLSDCFGVGSRPR